VEEGFFEDKKLVRVAFGLSYWSGKDRGKNKVCSGGYL